MKRFLFFSVAVAAVSALSAQEPLPDAVRLLDQQWRGDWRTVQYVLESPSGSLTVAIEKPQRLRAELKSREGWSLTVVSNGESTWVYNSDVKRYARFDGSRPPEAWLFRLDELLLRHMTGARDDVLTPRWRDLRTRGTESVRVLGTPRESWMVQGFAFDLGGEWSKRTVWIDKDLLIPIQLATALNEQPLYARVRSLRVDQPIPSSTFMFAVSSLVDFVVRFASRRTDPVGSTMDGAVAHHSVHNGGKLTARVLAVGPQSDSNGGDDRKAGPSPDRASGTRGRHPGIIVCGTNRHGGV
jgi:outer membrane lipoprotein-sorting protein